MASSQLALQERLERWTSRLQNLTVSPLTRDYPEQDSSRKVIEAFETLTLPEEAHSAAVKLSKIAGCSEFVTFLAAYVVLISRLTGDEDIAVGTSIAEDGRPFVLRVPVSFEESFESLQSKVEKVLSCPGCEDREKHIMLTADRYSLKVRQTLSLYVLFEPTSNSKPSQRRHQFSSALLHSRPLRLLRSTLQIFSIRQILF